MNLQKELVSQEILIDERLTSGEHKKAVSRKSSGSPIPSAKTCEKDEKVMDFPKERTPRSECVPRKRLSDWIEDRKKSSDENEVEDRNKLDHSSVSGTDRMNLQKELVSQEILIDERLTSGEHKKAVSRKSSGSPIPSAKTCEKDEKIMDFSKERTPRSECVPRKRLSDWIEDRKDSSDENESQVEDRNKLDHSSASDVHFLKDADRKDSSNENASQEKHRKQLERSSAPDADRKDYSNQLATFMKYVRRKKPERSSTSGADRMNLLDRPRGGDIQHDRVERFHLAGVINAADNQPVVWAPPPPPDPPNPN